MKPPARQPHESEWVYSTTLSRRLLTPLSEYVHDLPSPSCPAIEICIAACGYAFNPVIFPCWPVLVYLTSLSSGGMKRPSTTVGSSPSSNAWRGGHRAATNDAALYATNVTIAYLASALVTLAFTEIGKASFATTRPPTRSKDKSRRYGGLVASLKSKHSFPSGDCSQAMNLCMMLWMYVPPPTINDDADGDGGMDGGGMLQFWRNVVLFGMLLPGVAFARVYYRCHWIEDCLGGMLLSCVIHHTIIPVIATRIKTGSAHWFEF